MLQVVAQEHGSFTHNNEFTKSVWLDYDKRCGPSSGLSQSTAGPSNMPNGTELRVRGQAGSGLLAPSQPDTHEASSQGVAALDCT